MIGDVAGGGEKIISMTSDPVNAKVENVDDTLPLVVVVPDSSAVPVVVPALFPIAAVAPVIVPAEMVGSFALRMPAITKSPFDAVAAPDDGVVELAVVSVPV